jgi:hypothetical protein
MTELSKKMLSPIPWLTRLVWRMECCPILRYYGICVERLSLYRDRQETELCNK